MRISDWIQTCALPISRTLHAPGNRTHGLHRRGLHDSVGARPPVGIAARPARRMRAGKGHLAKFRKRIGGRHRNLADSERVHGAHMVTFILRIEPRLPVRRNLSSEERRGGEAWVSTCRFRWSPYT